MASLFFFFCWLAQCPPGADFLKLGQLNAVFARWVPILWPSCRRRPFEDLRLFFGFQLHLETSLYRCPPKKAILYFSQVIIMLSVPDGGGDFYWVLQFVSSRSPREAPTSLS
jgi:hypothetical protein